MIAPVELVRELLHYRGMKRVSIRDWATVTAFLAGSSLAVPLLAPFAIASIVGLAVHRLRRMRRLAIAGVTVPPTQRHADTKTLYGTARKFRTTITSLVDDAEVLIEHAVVRDRKGGVLLRRATHAPFLLDTVDGGQVLVSGVTRVSSPTLIAHHGRVGAGDPRLQRMGVPDDLAVAGELEIATVGEHSPILAVTGVVVEEAVADLAFHRDGGLAQVMRGHAGAPVTVEDRRMIAAMPQLGTIEKRTKQRA
jgi:hypothetical protein